MGPGGNWNFGSPLVQYMGGQKPLSLEEAGHFLASAGLGLVLGGLRTGGSIVSGFLHWRLHHHETNQDSVWHQLDHVVNPSPGGGGGPPVIPNLHRPPPSIEETGEILSNPPLVNELKDWARSKVRRDDRCRAYFRGDRGEYPVPVRCVKKAGHRGKHRKGRFTWKG